MSPKIDFEQLDLRGAFDLAIMIEEDAQLRYEELVQQFPDEPGGAVAVFRQMAVNEAKHRADLEARRRVLFKTSPPRIEISVLDAPGVEEPGPGWDTGPTMTAREALEMALAAEVNAFEFYAGAIPHVKDAGVRAFFQELMEEELEHQALLKKKLAELR